MPCIFDVKPEDRSCQYCTAIICDERQPKSVETFTNSMTDKEKILAKIESLLNETNYEPYTDEVFGRIESLKELKSYIDSLQEESVSDELDEAVNNALNNVLNSHEIVNIRSCLEMFRFGANWKKEQLIKEAINGIARPDDGEVWCDLRSFNLKDGDKLKLIIIKED